MKISHSLETLKPRAADERRRELTQCFEYLLEREGGPLDLDPALFDFIYEEHTLGKDGVEIAQVLDGHVSGSTLDGLVEYTSKPLLPDEDKLPMNHHIVFQADSILYEQWQEDREGNPARGRRELICVTWSSPPTSRNGTSPECKAREGASGLPLWDKSFSKISELVNMFWKRLRRISGRGGILGGSTGALDPEPGYAGRTITEVVPCCLDFSAHAPSRPMSSEPRWRLCSKSCIVPCPRSACDRGRRPGVSG